jgi:hypothetical protein
MGVRPQIGISATCKMSARNNRSRRGRNELPLGLRLLFAGIVMLVVSSAFAELGLPGMTEIMGLLAFIGFWMAAGGLLILVGHSRSRWAWRSSSARSSQPSGTNLIGCLDLRTRDYPATCSRTPNGPGIWICCGLWTGRFLKISAPIHPRNRVQM